MSLKIAVETIIAGLREEIDARDDGAALHDAGERKLLRDVIRQLEIAVKAAGDTPAFNPMMMQPDMSSAAFSHRTMIERAKAEFMGKIKPIGGTGDVGQDAKGQEFHDNMDRMYPVVGGPAGGGDDVESLAPLPSNAPVGCHTVLAGAVYTLGEDNQLYYNEDYSRRYALSRATPEGTIKPGKKSLVLTTEMGGVAVVEEE